MQRTKSFLKGKAPGTYRALSRIRAYGQFAFRSPEVTFTRIYRNNRWGSSESHSGTGSDLVQTSEIRRQLPLLIAELQCRSILDVPCGDYNWMSHVELDVASYIGADIVSALAEANQATFGDDVHAFVTLDLTRDKLPPADLILCRDCLAHLSFSAIGSALRNMRSSGSKYLLTTTYTARDQNHDISTGAWRPINLELPPFNFPSPLRLIDELSTEFDGQFADKHLGLWLLADLPQ
jgi:hypothetical protein